MTPALDWPVPSAVKCGVTISDYFPVNGGGRQGCVLAPTHSRLYGPCTRQVVEKRKKIGAEACCSEKTESLIVTFADDAVIFEETTEVLSEALESLNEEAEPLRLRVFFDLH